MSETIEAIEVLGARLRVRRGALSGSAHEGRTPLGLVVVYRAVHGWAVLWWPRGTRQMGVHLLERAGSAADAAREATRRLRAIMRTCARAGAV